jgi:hypothetical protein
MATQRQRQAAGRNLKREGRSKMGKAKLRRALSRSR